MPGFPLPHHPGRLGPRDTHVGRSSSWRSRCFWRTPPCWTLIIMGSRCSWRTSPRWTLIIMGSGSSCRTPLCWTFIVMEVEVLLENPSMLDIHRHGDQSAPGEPLHVGCSSSWRSRCFWRTPPRWTFIVMEVRVLLDTWVPCLDIGVAPPRTLGFLTSPHPV